MFDRKLDDLMGRFKSRLPRSDECLAHQSHFPRVLALTDFCLIIALALFFAIEAAQ